jgi:hypothetical protein
MILVCCVVGVMWIFLSILSSFLTTSKLRKVKMLDFLIVETTTLCHILVTSSYLPHH